MEIIFNFEQQRNILLHEKVHLRNDDKRLSIDGENRFFHIRVTFSNLRHTQICIADKFCIVNYAKKYERESDVKPW